MKDFRPYLITSPPYFRAGFLKELEEQAGHPVSAADIVMEDERPEPCEVCGGEITVTATLIGCRACGDLWGRVNGHWVHVPNEEKPA